MEEAAETTKTVQRRRDRHPCLGGWSFDRDGVSCCIYSGGLGTFGFWAGTGYFLILNFNFHD